MTFDTLKSSFKDKKVFLTGHTGFKGSWMLCILRELGAIVKGYALQPNSKEDLFCQIGGDNLCDSIIHDILDLDQLRNSLISFKPDYIFHFAAQALVLESYKKPIYTYDVNVIGTANLLSSFQKLNNSCTLIVITTDKVYNNREWHYPYREVDELGGHDPYSSSKACAELLVSSFQRSFFSLDRIEEHNKRIATARAGNVIGGGDWSENRIIPDTIKSLLNNEKIHLRNPKAIRPWQHVMEPLFGYLLLAAKLDQDPRLYSGAWNFGPDQHSDVTVEELAKTALQVWGRRIDNLTYGENKNQHQHEAMLLKLDINKSKNRLGWRPRLSQEESIQLTINWYKQKYLNNIDPKEITLNQIKDYISLIN